MLVIALIPWAVLLSGLYMWAEPAPAHLVYAAPYFVSRPVDNREDATKYAVSAVLGGSVVYRYIEVQIDRPFTGTSSRAWVNSALVWHAPDLPTVLTHRTGFVKLSIAVEVPVSTPTRTFQYVHKLTMEVNMLRDRSIRYPPIPLTILSPEDAAQRGA